MEGLHDVVSQEREVIAQRGEVAVAAAHDLRVIEQDGPALWTTLMDKLRGQHLR